MAGGVPWTAADDAAIMAAYTAHGGRNGWPEVAAKATGRSPRSIVQRKTVIVAAGRWPGGTVRGARLNPADATLLDVRDIAAPLTKKPLSVDDVIAQWQIDTKVWEPYAVTPNTWQVGAKHPETGKILTENLYQTKVRFRRKPGASLEQLKTALLADIAADAKARAKAATKVVATRRHDDREPHALEVDLFDIHLNKLAWAAETGADYDSHIAEARARAATTDLLAGAAPYRIEKVILPLGNDLTNADNLLKSTTAGTPQDTDTRYHRMFRRARGLTSWMIQQCAAIAPVEVVVVPGNHDELTAWTIGQVLEAEYTGNPRVTFQSGPKLRKYVHYGANLVGFAHGVDEPHGQLPQIMAVEQPEAWSQSTYREWHIGHLHKQRANQPVMVDDKVGVTVRIIRALTGTDAWHFRKGYIGGVQGAEAFVWRKSGGLRAHLYHVAEQARG